MSSSSSGPLAGVRVLEIAGLGPGPFCAMLLADLGADVVLVDRAPATADDESDAPRFDVHNRGKRSIALDLKSADDVELVLRLVESADVLIEGMRPGVMERLGLGPDVCLARNSKLVYGRMTGWGQSGPLAHAAGHDINYIGLSGALWWSGQPGDVPMAPPSLVGDIGGGAMYLAVGILAGVMHVRAGGSGQVVDAAIVDGSAHMLNLMLGLKAAGQMPAERGRGLLDGPHWYRSYRCADGKFITLGAVEPKFYALLLQKLGLAHEPDFMQQNSTDLWPEQHERWVALFGQRTRDAWCALLEGTDACFAPVLDPDEAALHPHMQARGVYANIDGVAQAQPAPRFSVTSPPQPGGIPRKGQHRDSVMHDWLKTA